MLVFIWRRRRKVERLRQYFEEVLNAKTIQSTKKYGIKKWKRNFEYSEK